MPTEVAVETINLITFWQILYYSLSSEFERLDIMVGNSESTSTHQPQPQPRRRQVEPKAESLVNGTGPADGSGHEPGSSSATDQLTPLQKHIVFWDRDNDGVIWPLDVYRGFRDLGFCIPYSLGALLIPIFFSYPVGLAYSYLPDPFMRIRVDVIHRAKHGSDTGVYNIDGQFDEQRFENLFERFDSEHVGGLSSNDIWNLWRRNRVAADPAGWSFAFMEWWTTWLLLSRDGRVWKEDLKSCYDGTFFWRVLEERKNGPKKATKGWPQMYGLFDFYLA